MPLDMSRHHMIHDARTLEQKLDYIQTEGNLSNPEALLKRLLWALEIEPPKEKAENLILFGCYNPYRMPHSIQSYLRLLDRLGITYTYLTKEFCCGFPLLEQAISGRQKLEDVNRLEEACREFMGRNMSAGRERGAKSTVYFCVWCAHLGKKLFPEDSGQFYFPDILLDRLQNINLQVPPTVVGYYEGCHLRNREYTPGVELDWTTYRGILGKIKGLKVVEMNDKTCCVMNPNRVIEEAESLNLDTIVCSCPACHIRLANVGKGRIRVRFFSDVLYDALNLNAA